MAPPNTHMNALTPRLLASLVLALVSSPSWSQSVGLAGILGSKALLVIDGGAPKALAKGEVYQNVTVLQIQTDSVSVSIKGTTRDLRLGESPISVRSSGSKDKLILQPDPNGHFITAGSIQNERVVFMVDTGASMVSISKKDADRIGLKYKENMSVMMSTANGISNAWQTKLTNVRIGDIDVPDVDAIITPQPMPYILLGNSALKYLQMSRNSEQMILEKRN